MKVLKLLVSVIASMVLTYYCYTTNLAMVFFGAVIGFTLFVVVTLAIGWLVVYLRSR